MDDLQVCHDLAHAMLQSKDRDSYLAIISQYKRAILEAAAERVCKNCLCSNKGKPFKKCDESCWFHKAILEPITKEKS